MLNEECGICFAQEMTGVKHVCKHEGSAREFIARIRDALTQYNSNDSMNESGVMREVRAALVEFDRQVTIVREDLACMAKLAASNTKMVFNMTPEQSKMLDSAVRAFTANGDVRYYPVPENHIKSYSVDKYRSDVSRNNDECNCTSVDLLTFGHKCGRKAPIDTR